MTHYLRNTALFAALLITSVAFAQPKIGLTTIASGFVKPVDIKSAGDDRLFIVEQDGYIDILHADGTVSEFLNIDSKVSSSGSEQGLLGLAFHPNYASNGYFYVNYINNSGNTVIARYQVTADPDVADPSSEFILMTVTQPYSNHNGGDLNFGPDGYLYIGLGDGGSGGDPGNRAQDITNQKLGKLLRIDVDGGTPFANPPSNPFIGVAGDDDIWAYGLRNPWRWSFDKLTGDLWIGDVGQDAWEEVDFQAAGDPGGENYGWRCYEGNHVYNFSLCSDATDFTYPIFEYPHDPTTGGYAEIGGYVYRGSDFPGMYGYYIEGDEVTGNFWTIHPDATGAWVSHLEGVLQTISTFGQDNTGELYCANLNTGEIYRISDNTCGAVVVLSTHTTSTTANLTWNNVGSSKYKVKYRPMSGGAWINANTTSNTIALTGLTPSTVYTYKISNKCPGATTMYMSSGTFSTGPLRMGNTVTTIKAQVVPNPGSGLFTILHAEENTTIEVYDISGQMVFEQNNTGSNQLDLTALTDGIYFVRFINNNTDEGVQKLIIAR